MIQTRTGLFETNSSSTHSFSIGQPKSLKCQEKKIPRDVYYEVPEYKIANGHEESTIENTIISEVWKLSFLFNVVATYLNSLEEDSDDVKFLDIFSGLCGRAVDLSNEEDKKLAISRDLVYMKWISDVVFEETRTHIKIPIPSGSYFPYFDTLWSETKNMENDFYDDIYIALENGDEVRFKSLCREIIFNPLIVIQDSDSAYCCDIERNIL